MDGDISSESFVGVPLATKKKKKRKERKSVKPEESSKQNISIFFLNCGINHSVRANIFWFKKKIPGFLSPFHLSTKRKLLTHFQS